MFDGVVIGAGIAGIMAARTLEEHGLTFTVVEARDRIGGRVESAEIDGQILDLGGQWLTPGQTTMYGFAEEAGCDLIPPNPGALLLRTQGRVLTVEPDQSRDQVATPFEVADLGQAVLAFRRLRERITNNRVWTQANSDWLDQPLTAWMNDNVRTPAGQMSFAHMLNYSDVAALEGISLRQALTDQGGDTPVESPYSASGDLDQHRVAGGMTKVVDHMARPIKDHIRLGVEVVAIHRDENSVTVRTRDGEHIQASTAIVTLAPWLTDALEFSPALPDWRHEITTQIRPGNITKAFLVYDRPWWRDEGLSGQISADVGPVRVTFDVSDDDHGALMGFFIGNDASHIAGRTEVLRHRVFADALADIFGPDIHRPHSYCERNWNDVPFSQGSHVGHFAPGHWEHHGPKLAEPAGTVFFAGAEYADQFNGYLEGAALSGQQAAEAVAEHLR